MTNYQPGVSSAENAVVADLALDAAEPKQLDLDGRVTAFVLPQNHRVQVVESEQYLDRPYTKRGFYQFTNALSFGRFVQTHKLTDETAIFAALTDRAVVAVIDGPSEMDATAGWGRFRAFYQPELSPEWKHWTEKDNKLLPQEAFSELVMDGLPEIVEPDGITMLELARGLEVTAKATVKGRVNRVGGNVQIAYDEESSSIAAVQVPETFELGLKPFTEGARTYRVKAQFKFRASSDGIQMGYRLIRPEATLREAFNDVLAIIEAETAISPYLGTPE